MTPVTKDERRKTKRVIQGQRLSWQEDATVARVLGRWRAFVLGPSSFVVILFTLALLLRLYNLGTQSLWLDELNAWSLVTQSSWGFLWNELWRSESAYPLYHLLLKAWIALAGDNEWALRFPSALAGAGAVVAVYGAAGELGQKAEGRRQKAAGGERVEGEKGDKGQAAFRFLPSAFSVAVALLLLLSPFALWYAQEVKTYSLLLLASALTVWLLLRGLRGGSRGTWVAWSLVALVSVFVHRFALLLLLGCAAAWLASHVTEGRRQKAEGRRVRWLLPSAFCLLLSACLLLVWQMTQGIGSEGASTGAHIPAGPVEAVWITLWRFGLDRGPGEAPWLWLLPVVALALWGAVLVLRDAWRGEVGARALLCMGVLPVALFLAQLLWTHLFEPRYLMIVYPVWVLVLGYPVGPRTRDGGLETGALGMRQGADNPRSFALRPRSSVNSLPSTVLTGLVLLAGVAALFQPGKGLWSGAAVKEQYREAVLYIAQRVHPDDVVVLHPEYLRPAWNYYAPRVSADPLPTPVAFDAFKQGQQYYSQKDWDTSREKVLNGHLRSFLMIAPPHARTVDQPDPKHPEDEYGLVGLYYQFSLDQNKWPCGNWRFNGVHVWCQESPEPYASPGVYVAQPEPLMPLHATFGGNINLRGYTLAPFGGSFRAGGTLPITLFWDVTQQPSEDYFVFVHVCRDCTIPPVASDDGPPLGGGLPTHTWLPKHPLYDERTVVLPKDLPPGRYTLLLGLYRPGDASPNARLKVSGTASVDDNRVIIGTVDVVAP